MLVIPGDSASGRDNAVPSCSHSRGKCAGDKLSFFFFFVLFCFEEKGNAQFLLPQPAVLLGRSVPALPMKGRELKNEGGRSR